MRFLRAFLLSALALEATCMQEQIQAVEALVADIIASQSNYVNFHGNQTNSTIQSRQGASSSSSLLKERATEYWYEGINHQGISAFGPSGYQVFRNVKSYGAKGDGVTDDTQAINNAITDGNRCNQGCASSTTTPAVVYFPAGTYKISSSIVVAYYTQLIGDPNNMPVLQATSSFSGFGLIDGDKYYSPNLNWGATNVFYRQVRNFVLDTATNVPAGSAITAIHWPTAQATSLQNLVFKMNSAGGTQHVGVFIESGSGGFMTDLTFNGGLIGMHVGNQQFTMRNIAFNDCVTAIVQLWSWGWVYQGITISGCGTGIDLSNTNATNNNQFVGSVTMLDSSITNTPVGVLTGFTSNSLPNTGGTLILENVVLSNVGTAVKSSVNGATILGGSSGTFTLPGWGQGNKYSPIGGPARFQGSFTPNTRPSSLLSGSNYYTRSKPQYNNLPTTSFKSVRSAGATGNGVTDDTNALQNVINSATSAGQIVFFDAGTYLVSKTLSIPPGAKLVGESYSVIMSSGSYFNDMNNPKPVVQVGTSGQTGQVEWSDMIVSTQGAQPGAILIEWNLATSGTPSGMWDVHARIGGFTGSDLQVAQCEKNPGSTAVNTGCIGAYMTMHVTPSASGLYMENNWLWTADHDIDDQSNTQITIYSGRGLFVESTAGTIWLVGTAVEHHTLYQYQFANTKDIYMGFIQTETPYYQPNPQAPAPFSVNTALTDPNFASSCSGQSGNCAEAWGLRIVNSNNILTYGAGLYSFFNNYNTACSANGGNCQTNILSIEGGLSNVNFYDLSTVGATNMVVQSGSIPLAKYSDNEDVYPSTIAIFQSPSSPSGWNLLGCYYDNPTARTLGNYVIVPGGTGATTIDSCLAACKAAGYSLAGVEYANECFCDNALRNGGGPAKDGNAGCNMPCAGNSDELCGGNQRLDLYQATQTSTTSWSYMGCFTDNTSSRTLKNYIVVPGGQGATTRESCQSACQALGYTVSGVEYANECFCDNAVEQGGEPAPDGTTGCNMGCAGNSAEICGGNLRIDLFQSTPWVSLGCYTDNVNTRTLTNYVVVPGGQGATTIETCQAACKAAGYVLAGVEYANECFCDNSIKNGGAPAPDGTKGCNMKCAGNSGETCGGNLRLNVYQANTGGIAAKSWKSLGCYTDNTSTRTLANYQSQAANGMTIESCQAVCLAKGYSYAGVEYANECFCDNKIESPGAPASSGCNMACVGNSKEICGGNLRVNVYEYS